MIQDPEPGPGPGPLVHGALTETTQRLVEPVGPADVDLRDQREWSHRLCVEQPRRGWRRGERTIEILVWVGLPFVSDRRWEHQPACFGDALRGKVIVKISD